MGFDIMSDSKTAVVKKELPIPESLDGKNITVCLDTNIYLGNLNNKHFFENLKRLKILSGLSIVTPEIILKELSYNLNKLNPSPRTRIHEINNLIDPECREITLKISKYTEVHIAKLKELSKYRPISLEATKKGLLRMISHIPPAGDNHQTKDAVIWEELIELSNSNTLVLFVTENGRDFWKNRSLIDEGLKNGIYFFSSIKNLYSFLNPFIQDVQNKQRKEQEKISIVQKEGNVDIHSIDVEGIYFSQLSDDITHYDQLTDYIDTGILREKYYYDTDLEFDASEVTREVTDRRILPHDDQVAEIDIHEDWSFTFGFSCSSDITLGGRDGIEVSKSGHETGEGTLSVERTITISIVDNSIEDDVLSEPYNLDLTFNDEFDPDDPTDVFWDDHE